MTNVKTTLTSAVLAAAVFGLALSFGASPANAHCKGNHADADKCDSVAEGRSETFDVELIDGELATGVCIGWSKRKQVTDANFLPSTEPGCGDLTIPNDFEPFESLHLCQVNINHKGRPDMTVTMFFTAGVGVVGGALCPEDVYQGEFLAEFDPFICAGEDPDATCVTITQPGVLALEKTSQPGKGDPAGPAGGVPIGTIVWTPVSE